jgi:transcriptional regulator with XRE-family HTH domain
MSLGPNLQEIWESFPEQRKQRIEESYQQGKAEYLTLQELRKSLDKTQTDVATALNVRQVSVSDFEKGKDPRISTIQDFIEALGGNLEITARFPGRPPVILRGFGEDNQQLAPRPA